MSSEVDVTSSNGFRRSAALVALVTVIVVVCLVVWFAADVFLLIFIGTLLASLLSYLAGLLSRRTVLGYGASLALVLVLLAALLIGLLILFGTRLAAETDNLRSQLQETWKVVQDRIKSSEWIEQLFGSNPMEQIASSLPEDWLSQMGGVFSTTLGVLGSIGLILFIGVFIAVDPDLYRRGILRLVSIAKRDRANEVLDELAHGMRGWCLGQLFSMSVVGVATALGLWMLGIPFAMTLGLLAGLLTFVPNFGPILSAVPAILLGLTDGLMPGLYVLLLYLAVQAVESNLLTPLVQQRSVDLPPVLNVGIQILSGVLFGILGLIAAAPLAVCGMVLVKRLYVEDVLGDQVE